MMDISDVRRLLNATHELESLLALALERGSVNPALGEAISGKASAIADLGLTLASGQDQAPEEETPFPEFYSDEEENASASPASPASIAPDVPEPEPAAPEAASAAPEPAPVSRRPFRSLISVNDRFLFRRRLFGGNDSDFEASLSLVENFSGLTEAEEYFYGDLLWDAEDPDVKAFMDLVTRYCR